jgi:hypothetical protein
LLAVKRQQRLAKACQLAVPQLADLSCSSPSSHAGEHHGQRAQQNHAELFNVTGAAEAGTDKVVAAAAPGSSGSSNSAGSSAWADTLDFAQQFGCNSEQLPSLMASVPRSKTEKAATKQAMAAVKAKIEPAACDLAQPNSSKGQEKRSNNPCKPPTAACRAAAAANCLQDSDGGTKARQETSTRCRVGAPGSPASTTAAAATAAATPLLQEVTKLHLLAFSREASSPQQQWAGAAVDLEAPVLTPDTAAAQFAKAAAAATTDAVPVEGANSVGGDAEHAGRPTVPAVLLKVTVRGFSCKLQTAACFSACSNDHHESAAACRTSVMLRSVVQ